MKKYRFVCTFINSRGDTRVRYFEDMESGLAFCDISRAEYDALKEE